MHALVYARVFLSAVEKVFRLFHGKRKSELTSSCQKNPTSSINFPRVKGQRSLVMNSGQMVSDVPSWQIKTRPLATSSDQMVSDVLTWQVEMSPLIISSGEMVSNVLSWQMK